MAAESAGRRRLLASSLALVAAALVLAGVPATAAPERPPDARRQGALTDRPWSGFEIRATGRASGEWLGARRVAQPPRRIVYRVDPRADPRPGRLGPARPAARLLGTGRHSAASPRATAQAAWIVSKYGSLRYEVQSAAVDAAVLHLLAGGRYRLQGRAGKARLRQSGQGRDIRRFASTMVRDSRRLAGPYRITARQAREAVVGDDVRIDLGSSVARSGVPLGSLPYLVRVDSGEWREAGTIGGGGHASYSLAGLAAGPHRVQVRVRRVPESRLLVLNPARAGASRDVLAGRKRTMTISLRVVVLAQPQVRVFSTRTARGAQSSARLQVADAYGRSPRSATAVLHGPFGSRGQATCQRSRLRVRHPEVVGNGTVALPRLKLERAGYYVWYVGLPGDTYNRLATTCSGIFRVSRR